jgi:hypothetical protein
MYPSVTMPPTVVAIPATLPPWVGGGGASGGFQHNQASASSAWSIPHSLGRIPGVDVYVAGEQVEADVDATSSLVVITFPTPYSGVAILT